MSELIKRYKAWKKENPDEDYQYDEVHEFIADLSRGEQLSMMESLESLTALRDTISEVSDRMSINPSLSLSSQVEAFEERFINAEVNYKCQVELTKDETEKLTALREQIEPTVFYVARDEDGDIYAFDEMPLRDGDRWIATTKEGYYFRIGKDLFPELNYKDDPQPVRLLKGDK